MIKTTYLNHKLYLLIFTFILLLIFIPGLLMGEGQGCADFPDNPELCPSTSVLVSQKPPPPPGPVNYNTGKNVTVSINPDFEILPRETFSISWKANWTSAEDIGGQNIYTVTLYEDDRVLNVWNADTEFGEQPPESESFEIAGGITNDTEYTVVGQIVS